MNRRRVVVIAVGLAVVVLLAIGAWFIFRPHHGDTPHPPEPEVVIVEAFYPGANAQVVADTIAAPIEQQVNGVEGMLQMVSRSADDGTYTLQVAFQPGTDLDMAQVLVQNRAFLATPQLPEIVKFHGITTKKRQPCVLAIVTLAAKDGRRSESELTDYANEKIKDELAHVVGVGDIAVIGPRDHKNVATPPDGFAILNGAPVAALIVWPLTADRAREVSAEIDKSLAALRKELPEGMVLERSFDFARLLEDAPRPDDLIVDVRMPDGASQERTRDVLRRCEELLLKTPAVKQVLSLSLDPFELSSERACMVVRLATDEQQPRDKVMASIRDRFHQEIKEAVIQVRDLSGPRRFPCEGYPIELAICDTQNLGREALQQSGDDLVKRMRESDKLKEATVGRATAGVVMRLNLYPMVTITANAAPGVSLTEAREECERLAKESLPMGFRMEWLSR